MAGSAMSVGRRVEVNRKRIGGGAVSHNLVPMNAGTASQNGGYTDRV